MGKCRGQQEKIIPGSHFKQRIMTKTLKRKEILRRYNLVSIRISNDPMRLHKPIFQIEVIKNLSLRLIIMKKREKLCSQAKNQILIRLKEQKCLRSRLKNKKNKVRRRHIRQNRALVQIIKRMKIIQ